MKALLCKQHGLPNTLKIEEIASPKASAGKVIISVHACSVNFPDTLIIRNMYQFKPELPFSPGGEVAGIVKEIGEGVKNLKVGDRVFALCGWGGFAEEVEVDAKRTFQMLPAMDFITGASVMYNYGTSYHALKDRGRLQAGETLLVLGAGGGVGLAAVEIAKLMGATVIAAASSDEKLAVCNEKGADFTINYSTEDLRDKIKHITQGKGVDVVYDPIGDKYAEPALRSVAYDGRYLVVGFAAGEIPKIPLNLALLKSCSIVGVFWGQFAEKESGKNFKNIIELAGYFREGKLKPHIHKLYTLDNAANAIADLMNRKVIGKAVVVVNPEKEVPAPPYKAKEKPIEIAKEDIAAANGAKQFKNLASLQAAKGQSLGTSEWITINQEAINDFAKATKDFQWIHIDVERAKAASPFGTTIAHGFNVLALSPNFLYKMLHIESATISLNYGCNKVRFVSPCPVDSRVRMHATIKEVEMGDAGNAKIFIDVIFEIEGQEKPVCVAELVSMIFE